jgi:hypothetical protein
MGQLIVAVKSCQRDKDAGFHDAIRETWGRDLKQKGVQVMFFIGLPPGTASMGHPQGYSQVLQRDEFVVNAADDYNSLPFKTRGICQWATSKVFTHLFLCDNDTIINPKALLALPYEPFDYSGHFRGGQAEVGVTFHYHDHMGDYPECHPWASGGIGYFISKHAAELIAETYPKIWAEDMFVGQVLGKEIMKGNMLGQALHMNGLATWHFRKSKMYPEFTPDLLRRAHREGSPENIYEESFA